MPQDRMPHESPSPSDLEERRAYHRGIIRGSLQVAFDAMQSEWFTYSFDTTDTRKQNELTDQMLEVYRIMERYKDAEQSTT